MATSIFEVIARAISPERVGDVLVETGTASERERDLPAQVMGSVAKIATGHDQLVAAAVRAATWNNSATASRFAESRRSIVWPRLSTARYQ